MAKFTNVTPPLTSHVNYIQIFFLKMLGSMYVERMQIYKSMSQMQSSRWRYFVIKYTAAHAQSHVSLEWTVIYSFCVILHQSPP